MPSGALTANTLGPSPNPLPDYGEGEKTPQRSWRAMLIASVIFAALSITCAVTSQGFLEADACTHYQYARFALGETHYLVNVWGRPFVTALYAVPAVLGGRMGVRVTSLCCALVIAWL